MKGLVRFELTAPQNPQAVRSFFLFKTCLSGNAVQTGLPQLQRLDLMDLPKILLDLGVGRQDNRGFSHGAADSRAEPKLEVVDERTDSFRQPPPNPAAKKKTPGIVLGPAYRPPNKGGIKFPEETGLPVTRAGSLVNQIKLAFSVQVGSPAKSSPVPEIMGEVVNFKNGSLRFENFFDPGLFDEKKMQMGNLAVLREKMGNIRPLPLPAESPGFEVLGREPGALPAHLELRSLIGVAGGYQEQEAWPIALGVLGKRRGQPKRIYPVFI